MEELSDVFVDGELATDVPTPIVPMILRLSDVSEATRGAAWPLVFAITSQFNHSKHYKVLARQAGALTANQHLPSAPTLKQFIIAGIGLSNPSNSCTSA